jgi:hypothetical protein
MCCMSPQDKFTREMKGPKQVPYTVWTGKSAGLEDRLPKWVIQLRFIHSWVVITIDGRIPGLKNLGFKV